MSTDVSSRMLSDKKIVFIHHGHVPGGAPTSLRNTLIGLQKRGFSNVKVLCVSPRMEEFFRSSASAVTGSLYSPPLIIGRLLVGLASIFSWKALVLAGYEAVLFPRTLIRQVSALRKESPHLVHLNSSILLTTAIAAKICRIPLVWHVREVLIGSKWNPRRAFYAWTIRSLSDAVVCISELEAKAVSTKHSKNINVVYNFIDFSEFARHASSATSVGGFERRGDRKVFVSLGGVSFRKGTYEILQAAAHMPEADFIVAGSMPLEASSGKCKQMYFRLIHQVEDLLVRYKFKRIYSWRYSERVAMLWKYLQLENLFFIGQVDSVASLLSKSDALIFAGCTPHFPRPVYEAWSLKKPVVVFNTIGISTHIKHMVSGVVCNRNDYVGLTDGLRLVAKDMGEAGYKRAKELFDMEQNIDQLITIYERVLRQFSNVHAL